MSSNYKDQAIPEQHRPIAPVYGGYYWFPTPGPDGVRWGLLTCEDLGFASDQGHPDLWPAVIDRLAVTWGKNATALRRHLKDRYSALPRGRVTRPDRYLILHGDDAPIADWLAVVIRSFRLQRVRSRVVFDDHERRLADDSRRLQGALGILIPAPTCRDSTPKR